MEVTSKIRKIEEDIKKRSDKKKILILITDLNLSEDECEEMNKIASRFQFLGRDVEVQLLDHHKSGEEQAKRYKWYFLDTERSATKITYDYFMKHYKPVKKIPVSFKEYVEAVNAYDLWNQDESGFEFGKVLNRACVDSREINPNLFPDNNFAYRSHVLSGAFEFMGDGRYIEYDDAILGYKKSFLAQGGKHDTIDNLVAGYVLALLNQNKENMTIYYRDYKGILTNAIGNSSVMGNAFLRANPDYDFFMDVGNSGNISLRADDKVDVSKIAARYFNGGGHPNASGGRAQGLKEIYIYSRLKEQIEERLDS